MKNLRVHLALFIVGTIFGISYVTTKYLLQYLPAAPWIFIRAGGAAFVLVLLVGKKLWRDTTKRDWLAIMYLAFFGVVINNICFAEGLARTTPTHAVVINTGIPIFTLIFSVFFRLEKLSLWRVIGMLTSLCGILLILEIEKLHLEKSLFWGDILTVGNATSFSLYFVLSRKLSPKTQPIIVTTGMFLIGTFFTGLYGASELWTIHWRELPALVYVLIVYTIVLGTVGTYYLNNWALTQVDSSVVAVYIYVQPVVAGFLSRLVYHERLTARTVLASLLVFAGVGIANFTSMKKGKNEIYVKQV